MITEEKLNKLYENIIYKKELTTKEITELGFNNKDINQMLEQNILNRIRRGIYIFTDVDRLYHYAKKVLSKNEREKFNDIINKCYKINENHYNTCFQLFFLNIKNEEYKKAFYFFEKLDFKDPGYIKDCNLYLFLLNLITEIPDKYKERVKNLKLTDLLISEDDKRLKNIQAQNEIIKAIYQKKFAYSISLLNKYSQTNNQFTVRELLIKILICQVGLIKKENVEKICSLLKEKKYDVALEKLEKNEKIDYINHKNYIIKLINIIKKIKTNEPIPEKERDNTNNLFQAIDGNNFELAYKLNQEFMEKHNIDKNNHMLNILLTEICILQKQKEIKHIEQIKIGFTDIINALLKNDIELSTDYIDKYLKQINKKEYINLILNLVQLSVLNNDNAYAHPITTLINISKDEYVYVQKEYIQKFYLSLAENKLSEAKLYFHILSDKNINFESINLEELYNALKILEKKFINDVEEPKIIKEEKHDAILPSTNDIKTSKKEISFKDNDYNFIKEKYQYLVENQGIALLKPMDKERRKRIHNIVKGYKDLRSFSIGEGEERQIVLQYSPYINEFINYNALFQEAKKAGMEKNYKEALAIYLKLLPICKNFNPSIYASIGLTYLNNSQIYKAIDYLIVATKLNKKENGYNFTELIAKLKCEKISEDRKPYIKMTEEDFTEQQDINIEEIINYIEYSNIDLRSACLELNMTEEQIDLTTLLFAKKYYIQGAFEKGEEFIKAFEKSNNKTEKTKKLFNEITKNKTLYTNQLTEGPLLTLTIKPL